MKKFFLLFFLSVVLGLIVAEIYFRITYNSYWLDINWTALNSRWTEPYIEFGDFRAATGRVEESPGHYDYQKTGPLFLYHPHQNISSITDRGRFLYLEREAKVNKIGEKRIFVMGGSAALGDGGSGGDNRFWVQLERKIRNFCGNEKIHVIPAAVRSFISTQERIALELYVLPLKPDAVIFFHGFNDLNHMGSMARPGDPYNQGVTYARSESFMYQTIQWWATFSRTVEFFAFKYLNQKLQSASWKLSVENKALADQYSREIVSVFLDNISAMAKRCSQEKVPCYFVNQPAQSNSRTNRYLYWLSYNKIEPLYGKQKDFALGAKALNLVPKYLARPELFTDMVHMGDEGQNLVSDDVLNLLMTDKKQLCR